MAGREAAPDVEQVVRLCRLCAVRPVPACRIAHRDYRCNSCRSQYASHKASNKRQDASPRGRELHRLRSKTYNPKRIFIGQTYHSTAASAEQAARIGAHIKERLCHFRATHGKSAN
jgi:hypothetical protein